MSTPPVISGPAALQRLVAINNADWPTQYLSSTGEVKSRCTLWPIVKQLHLDTLPYIGFLFTKTNVQVTGAAVSELVDIVYEMNKQNMNPATQQLIEAVVNKVNNLFQHINTKRNNQNTTDNNVVIKVPSSTK